jgi:Leucine-rich repeat (LRR) protein
LNGSIPSELGYHAVLVQLSLYTNSLEGSIPSELGNLKILQVLELYDNSLEGTIPSELGNLNNLQVLELYDNSLGGTIPVELGDLLAIETLVLFSNVLEGGIPSELGSLLRLQVLYLNTNSLEGSIPNIGNLTELEVLYLYDNMLSGPLDFSKLPANLSYMDLGGNQFTGSLSLEHNAFPLLAGLNLSANKLYGPIDAINSDSTKNLQSLDLSNNYFKGTLAGTVFMISSLETIILSQNCFSGSLPDAICGKSNLENIVMDLLTGNCDSSVHVFQGFVLSRYMTGTIPGCVWNSSTIRLLHLLGNGLVGSVSDLTASSQISILALGSNQLSGTIPTTFQFHNFTQLDLSINRFSGTLESDMVISETTTVFDLSVNRLSGDIPDSVLDANGNTVLNILDGNLFECLGSQTSHSSYQCGSDDLEYSLIAWVVGAALILMVLTAASFFGIDWGVYKVITPTFLFILKGPLCCMGISLFAIFIFIATKRDEAVVSTSTHSVQYWWTVSAVFVHDWLISVLMMLLLALLCSTCVLTMMVLAQSNRQSNGGTQKSTFVHDITFCRYVGAHLVNVIVVTTANAAYILTATGRITGLGLLAVQAALGMFKLLWSATVIPWMLSWIYLNGTQRMAHWIFMVLFVYVGSPFMSTFCESTSCFLFVLTSPGSTEFSFADPFPFYVPSAVCNNGTCTTTLVSTPETIQDSIASPWIYSFQCSSAVITVYAPVLFLSYLMSGLIVPFVCFLLSRDKAVSRSALLTFVSRFMTEIYNQ